jgi:hypothetical protein
LTIVNARSLYVLEASSPQKPIAADHFKPSQVNGWDGNDSHHTPCRP